MRRESRVPLLGRTLIAEPDWPRKVQELGFSWHSMDGVYWDERACYRFTEAEVDTLEAATADLHRRCLEAVGKIVAKGDYSRFAIPEAFHAAIERSWKAGDKSLYGRFDF